MKRPFLTIAVLIIIVGSILTLIFFSDPLINRFAKPKITESLNRAFPDYLFRINTISYSIFPDRFEFDSITVIATDSMFTGTMGEFSVSGLRWIHILFGGELVQEDIAALHFEAEDVALMFHESQYQFLCKRIFLSVPDSTLFAESMGFQPLIKDEPFFRTSPFSQTRFITTVTECRVNGFDILTLFNEKEFRARSAVINELFLDLLVNNDKPGTKTPARMPHEILASYNNHIQIDTITIANGSVRYGERMTVGSSPALINIDELYLIAEGITNRRDRNESIIINARARFMNAGKMNLWMKIPVYPLQFALQYSGSLGNMDVKALNPFLEIAEMIRIKSGTIEKATFKIEVNNGRSSGEVHVQYKDLKIAVLNKTTGSAKGFMDGVASFIANTFTLRSTNMPDKSGNITIGKANYVRKKDDPFFRFVWFSLRSGLKDVVGF